MSRPHEAGRSPELPSDVPVLIVGGGGSGLTASILLADLGVGSLLVERHPSTSLVPKAHVIHSRTMEIFHGIGVDADVRHRGTPLEHFAQTTWYTSLGGEQPWEGRLIASLPSYGDTDDGYYQRLTAEPMANLPQHLLEPVLRKHAEARSGADNVRFSCELTALDQDDDGATATILDRSTGTRHTVRAQYVIGADGGKAVGDLVGVPMVGPEPFVNVVSITFKADLSSYLQEDTSVIRLFVRPNPDGTVRRFSIVACGPDRWDRHCTDWRSGIILPVGASVDRDAYTVDQAIADLRGLFELPDLEITDVATSPWLIESALAERFQAGRTFLVGDAAHRHSPMGGLGLNTGIQDVHNLCWKLAEVLRRGASPSLLNSYEAERQPVARRRVDFATFSFFNHVSLNGGFGMLPDASEEHNRGVLRALFSETADGEARRAQLEEMVYTLRRELQHADIDLGFAYGDSPVVVPDGSVAPPSDPVGHRYEPVARPGHRLPHAWLTRHGAQISTHRLIRPGRWLLLAGDPGEPWIAAGNAVADQAGAQLDCYAVGSGSTLEDPDGTWATLRGHGDAGAVLVRPDGHVAFRSQDADNASRALGDALALARGGSVPAGRT